MGYFGLFLGQILANHEGIIYGIPKNRFESFTNHQKIGYWFESLNPESRCCLNTKRKCYRNLAVKNAKAAAAGMEGRGRLRGSARRMIRGTGKRTAAAAAPSAVAVAVISNGKSGDLAHFTDLLRWAIAQKCRSFWPCENLVLKSRETAGRPTSK